MKPALSIYYATMTGNAESLARRVESRAAAEGWQAELRNLSETTPGDLTPGSVALFIVSTWGDGEPPDDAYRFFNDLNRATAPALADLRYAVLGLGDRDYADFNAFARQLDDRLAELGAQRFHERVEADLDFDDIYAAWATRIFGLLAGERSSSPVTTASS